MAQQRFSRSDRRAFWEAYAHHCGYCGNPLSLVEVQIDHIIPESLPDRPEDLANVRRTHGLSEDFDLRSDLNLIPSCGRCNGNKSALIPEPTQVVILLTKARQMSVKVTALRAGYQSEARAEKALARVATAIETGVLKSDNLVQFLTGSRLSAQLQPDENLTAGEPACQALEREDRELEEVLGAASLTLLRWPRLTGGHWLERPEEAEIRTLIDTGQDSFSVLIGPPGSGKSALLARVAGEPSRTGSSGAPRIHTPG